jgi:hypothetical protein
MKARFLIFILMLVILGCAGEKPIPSVTIPKETRTVLQFLTFRTNPPGADIFVVDPMTGKQGGYLGQSPIRIMVMKEKIDLYADGKISCLEYIPNIMGLAYGKIRVEGIEFQFKFKLKGFYDEIHVQRLPILIPNESDVTINLSLVFNPESFAPVASTAK